MKINPNKFILGTANLCTKYGIKSTLINESKSKELLNFAYKKNIKILDLSTDYKFYEKIKKNKNIKNWKMSFKVTNKDIKKLKNESDINKFIFYLLKVSNKKKIEYLFFHNPKDLLSEKGSKIFNLFLKIKKKNKIGKIGASVYTKNDIIKLLNKFDLDLIQGPFNIFDQRLKDFRIQKLFRKNKIEFHARSIFLQGIAADKTLLTKKIKNLNEIKNWFKYLSDNKKSAITETLNLINQNSFIKKIIIGARSRKQLKQILSTKIENDKKNYSNFKSKNLKLIDPRKW